MNKILKQLLDGNKRFYTESSVYPNQSSERRKEISQKQNPLAAIICCSDSRAAPEIVFDHGLGDIFVVRTAGNILDSIAVGSIEYAVEYLNVSLIVVLGHANCGAVNAVIQKFDGEGNIHKIIKTIKPAVELAKTMHGDLLTNAIKNNIKSVIKKLKSSDPIISKKIKNNKIEIIGAYYCLESGKIEIL